MKEFLYWTAFKMSKPEPYGLFHIFTTIILLSITVFVAFLLRKTNEKQNRIVLFIVGAFLLLSEIYKIAFHMTVNPYNWGFWGAFPFQLCSIPMYLSLFCAFSKNEKINSWLYESMFFVNMFGGIMAFIEPSGIQHEYWTLTIHAYIWHMLLIFIGLYLYMSKRVCNKGFSSYKKGIAVYLISFIVAQLFNLIFGDKINCFYISPFVRSPLAVFKNIYESCGWFLNMVLMLLAMLIASGIIFYIGHFIRQNQTGKASAEEKVLIHL